MPAEGSARRYSRLVTRGLEPRRLAPFFMMVAVVQIAAVASRFDLVAAKLPVGAAPGIMAAVVPLLVLAGYFEGRLDYGDSVSEMPLWMRIRSVPVKVAFTFGFIYLACVALQTFDLSIGPLDPTPPTAFPAAQRAMWFAMFTGGMFFPFYLAAAGALIPLLRLLTAPLRALPAALGAAVALLVGGALGLFILSAATSTAFPAFVKGLVAAYKAAPEIGATITVVTTLGPLILGLVRGSQSD